MFSCTKNIVEVEPAIGQLEISFPNYEPSMYLGEIRTIEWELKGTDLEGIEIVCQEEAWVKEPYIKLEGVSSFAMHIRAANAEVSNLHFLIRYQSRS